MWSTHSYCMSCNILNEEVSKHKTTTSGYPLSQAKSSENAPRAASEEPTLRTGAAGGGEQSGGAPFRAVGSRHRGLVLNAALLPRTTCATPYALITL